MHYSGHGVSVQDHSGDESDGQDEALVPTDFATKGVIIDDELTLMVSGPCALRPRTTPLTVARRRCTLGGAPFGPVPTH